jgi:hypothetical protein
MGEARFWKTKGKSLTILLPQPRPLPLGEGTTLAGSELFAAHWRMAHLCFPKTGDRFSLSQRERTGVRFRLKISRIEPLNLISNSSSVVGRSVTAFSFGAFPCLGLPAGEIGSARRHAYCLVTPPVRCSRWGGLSFRRRAGARRLASVVIQHLSL